MSFFLSRWLVDLCHLGSACWICERFTFTGHWPNKIEFERLKFQTQVCFLVGCVHWIYRMNIFRVMYMRETGHFFSFVKSNDCKFFFVSNSFSFVDKVRSWGRGRQREERWKICQIWVRILWISMGIDSNRHLKHTEDYPKLHIFNLISPWNHQQRKLIEHVDAIKGNLYADEQN